MGKFFFAAVIFCSSVSYAQDTEVSSQSSLTGFRRGLATVVLCGLGGAILGLSTLSFYPQPQEKIGNVTAGFGLGLVGGAIFVLSNATTPPSSTATNWDPLLQEKIRFAQIPQFRVNFSF